MLQAILLKVTATELIGYLGTSFVLLSFLMKDMRTLRIVRIVGCICFIVYGILIDYAIPVIITNVSIVIINLFYLIKDKK